MRGGYKVHVVDWGFKLGSGAHEVTNNSQDESTNQMSLCAMAMSMNFRDSPRILLQIIYFCKPCED